MKVLSAHTVAQTLLDYVFPLYGLPLYLHSGNAPEFTIQVWDHFITHCGNTVSHFSPYWPKGNAEMFRAETLGGGVGLRLLWFLNFAVVAAAYFGFLFLTEVRYATI